MQKQPYTIVFDRSPASDKLDSNTGVSNLIARAQPCTTDQWNPLYNTQFSAVGTLVIIMN